MVIVGGQLERPGKSFRNIRSKTLEELSGLDFVFNERENQSHSPQKKTIFIGLLLKISWKKCSSSSNRQNCADFC